MKDNKKKYLDKKKIIFIILINIGIIIRIVNFPNAISEINGDEIMTIINAKDIADTGKDANGISFPVYLQGWGGQSVMLLYLMALIFKIFNYSLFTARLPMLIVSIISLFVFYDFTKKITKNEKIALIGLAVLVISPWHILQSIWALDCNMFPHFLLIAMDLLYTGITKSNNKLIYISMIFYAITLYCYGVAIYFVPLFLLIFCIYLVKNKIINYKNAIICIILFLVFAMPIILMFAINALHINTQIKIFNITIPYYPNLSRTQDMLFFSDNKLSQLFNNIIATIGVMFIQSDGEEWNSSAIFGTTYNITIVFIIVIIISIIKTIAKEKKKINIELFLVLIWLSISILTGFIINNTNINRLNSVWYILLILSAKGIYIIYEYIKYKKAYIVITISIYVILFISYNIYFYSYYSNVIDKSVCFSKGFYQALSYVKNTDKKEVFYDNIMDDGNLRLYLDFNHDDNKIYTEIKNDNKLKEKIDNLNDDEAIIIYVKFEDYHTELNSYRIGDYKIIYNDN